MFPYELMDELSGRLPELEWQLMKFKGELSSKGLPTGLFRHHAPHLNAAYVDEIRTDLDHLKTQKNNPKGFYLAKLIERKINILVMICQQNRITCETKSNKEFFSLDLIATRKQWFDALNEKIKILTKQRDALIRILEQKRNKVQEDECLMLQKEVGIAEQQLTLAKEKLANMF